MPTTSQPATPRKQLRKIRNAFVECPFCGVGTTHPIIVITIEEMNYVEATHVAHFLCNGETRQAQLQIWPGRAQP